jgi:uncharacterized protein YpmS
LHPIERELCHRKKRNKNEYKISCYCCLSLHLLTIVFVFVDIVTRSLRQAVSEYKLSVAILTDFNKLQKSEIRLKLKLNQRRLTNIIDDIVKMSR